MQFRIPSHRIAEQRAIATALSDMDALLDGLDRLITKKRDLKQAAMQQLLTGQTRLPGFHGEWEVKRLGETRMVPEGHWRHQGSKPALATCPASDTAEMYTHHDDVDSPIHLVDIASELQQRLPAAVW